ncbi:MAG: hypothetical protein ABI340_08515 [Nitrososphaera sp.]|jgi:hypothetical protein
MKFIILAFALLGLLLISPYPKPIQADSETVSIVNPVVQPSKIMAGDEFAVNATIVNNSNQTISVHNDCGGAFSVSFDNHVVAGPTKICNFLAIQIILKPGENITRSSLFSVIGYKAVSPGTVNATITASYIPVNQTNSNLSSNPINVTKSFQFTILNQTTYTPHITSPLTQFKAGVAAKDVKCQSDLQLIIKSEDGSPACVKSQTAQRLVDLGWGTSP